MGLQSQLNDVHLLMHENIVNLNERGTKLDDMVDKTDKFADDVSFVLEIVLAVFINSVSDSVRK